MKNLNELKFLKDSSKMKKVSLFDGAIKYLEDPATGILYFDSCPECEQLLTEDEVNYGHECEV